MIRTRNLILLVVFSASLGCGPDPSPAPNDPVPVVAIHGQAADAPARDTAIANLTAIGEALHAYENAVGSFPPASATTDGNGLSWRVRILPHFGKEGEELYAKFRPMEPWDSPHNKTLIDQMPAVFASPGKTAEKGQTYLRGFIGPSAFFSPHPPLDNGRQVAPARGRHGIDITDAKGYTLAVAEAAESVIWTKPDEIPYDGKTLPKTGGVFPDGFHGLMVDGEVYWFPSTTREASLRATLTIANNDVADLTPVMYPCGLPTAELPRTTPDTLPNAAARRTAVQRMSVVGQAWLDYHGANESFPAGVFGPGGLVGLSWRVQLLPYLGHEELYKQFKLTEAWDSEHNKNLLDKMPDVYATAGKPPEKGQTFLRTTCGPQGVIYSLPLQPGQKPLPVGEPGRPVRGRRQIDFSDGLGNTILFAESETAVPWTKPDEMWLLPVPKNQQTLRSNNNRMLPPKLGKAFEGGFHAVIAFGQVVFYKATLPPAKLSSLLTVAGGEMLGDPPTVLNALYATPFGK